MCACLAAAPMLVFGQQAYGPQGSEYRILGSLPLAGDQMFSDLAMNSVRGYLIWQDNATDSNGLGISAQRIDQTLSGVFSPFKVNQIEAGQQEWPRAAVLQNGSAVFIWKSRGTNIAARFASNRGLLSAEFNVNSNTRHTKQTPTIATLSDDSVIVVWASEGQDGSMQGVYGQILNSEGSRVGGEFRLNTQTFLNQRTPSVAALKNGGFIATWINETGSEMVGINTEVVGRRFKADGTPEGNEFRVNSDISLCANPDVTVAADGTAVVAWSQKKKPILNPIHTQVGGESAQRVREASLDPDSWDIFGRAFTPQGTPKAAAAIRLNSAARDPQFAPKLGSLGNDIIAVWTTLLQDGDEEGLGGRFFNSDLTASGSDFQVNTRSVSKQLHPTIATSGDSRFLVAWSTFVGGSASYELVAQRYARTEDPLQAPSAPVVSPLSQSRVTVLWPSMSGLDVQKFLVYVNDNATPQEVAGNSWTITGLAPGALVDVRLKYQLADGRMSPASSAASARTWGEDLNNDGLPDDWQAQFWPNAVYPGANEDSDGDGASNLAEFLAATDPLNSGSVLRTTINRTSSGLRLNWNTTAGCVYQVQVSGNLTSWSNFGEMHFAAAATASTPISTAAARHTYYRVIRIR